MTDTLRIALHGDGFGSVHRRALGRAGLDRAEEPSDGGACWVAGSRVAAELLRRGIAVLAEQPMGQEELAGCVRQAHRSGVVFRLADPLSRLPTVLRFAGAARALRARAPIAYVAASCARDSLPALVRVLGDVLGTLRPWDFDTLADPLGTSSVLGGRLADVPISLRVREERPPGAMPDIEMVLGAAGGELALTSVCGPVVWTSGTERVPLGDPGGRDDWTAAVEAELRAFAQAVRGSGAAASDVQQQLTCCRLREDVLAALGPAPEAATVGVLAAELAAAAVEAADEDARALPDELPTAVETHEAGLTGVPDPEAIAGLPAAMERLGEISLAAVADLLSKALPGDEARTEEEITAVLGAAPRHAWLVRRWLLALTSRGVLLQESGRYRVEAIPVGTRDGMRDAYARLGFPPAMARFHEAALDELPRLVRDEVAVQHVLFAEGQVLSALSAYQDNVFTGYLNTACGYLLARCPRPEGGPLRVVELGGGAGLSTGAALRSLSGQAVDYLFTDVSRMFTVAARERFGDHPGLRYGLIDVDTDFAAQGVTPATADVVLAGNVLHNAMHVGRTLRRIRRALAPGGWLVFTESTRENDAVLTSMQFLLSAPPGRPRVGSEDRRAGSGQVFVDAEGWRRELVAAGFVPHFVLPDARSPLAVAGQHLFFATAS
ncbi:bifunctional Gfo/Idh/MocA family oxidoreductase/class I SAM-dependent methyltransferase [Streptomyces sp. NPDC050485]|uniref:bifunctional Gfo/Idh/MocA family oxidoreductase/class I SAM-dependent methyltransferase n=1 Tax=Streptomyces sp. NPDC050485 TaxID=3365617 RepID=UPI00378F72D4